MKTPAKKNHKKRTIEVSTMKVVMKIIILKKESLDLSHMQANCINLG